MYRYIKMNPILEEYSKKYSKEELTDDGIPTIETQIREINELDEKQNINNVNYNREMIQRVKCISLYKMGKSIMTNTNILNNRDRKKLQEIMHSYNNIDHKDIIDEFNIIVNDEIFENDIDYSKLPIYQYS